MLTFGNNFAIILTVRALLTAIIPAKRKQCKNHTFEIDKRDVL